MFPSVLYQSSIRYTCDGVRDLNVWSETFLAGKDINVGKIIRQTEQLRQEGVRVICQLQPKHIKISGDDIAVDFPNAT